MQELRRGNFPASPAPITFNRFQKLLCKYAFPDCLMSNHTPLPLCYEDCVAVKQLFCYQDWALIEDNKSRGIYFKSRGHFELPDCEKLPKYGLENGTATCTYAGLTEIDRAEITYDCIRGRGRFYLGKVNVTKDGLACQRWDSQTPHSHTAPPDIFPELEGAENYCRNAGGEVERPWCFTTNSSVRWQHCNIPQCANSSSEEAAGEKSITMDQYFTPTFLILVSIVGLFAVVVCMLLVLLCHRLKKQRLGYNPTETAEVNIDLDKLPSNMAYHRSAFG